MARYKDRKNDVHLRGKDLLSVTRPVKESEDFKKIELQPGELQTVALDLTPESLAFYAVNMKYVVASGEFAIMVGTSCRNEDLQKMILTVTK